MSLAGGVRQVGRGFEGKRQKEQYATVRLKWEIVGVDRG